MACRHFTDEELRAAWQRRRRTDWPPTFEEAMNDPTFSHLVRIEARLRSRLATAKHQPIARHAVPAQPTTQPMLDFKRRAAGERDDD